LTVPPTYTTTMQYFLVKFTKIGNQMTPNQNPILLSLDGRLTSGLTGGKVQFLYDESLQRYYLAGSTSNDPSEFSPLSFNGIPVSNDGYMISFSINNGIVTENWRREFTTYNGGSVSNIPFEKIFSLIKDN